MGTTIESLLTHREWVRRVARALVESEVEAEEIEQEAWARAVAAPPASEGGAKAWFRTVLRRVARDRWRTASRREVRESRIEPPSPSAPTADLVAEAEAHRLVVNAALALPEPYREAIVLRYFHELPAAEIAERLDIPLETLRTRVKRAIARLRDELDVRHGGDRKAWLGVVALLLPATAKAGTAVKAGFVVTAAAAVLATVLVWPGGGQKPPPREGPAPMVAAAPEIVEEPAVAAEIPPDPERIEVAAVDDTGEGGDLEAPPPPPPPPALVVEVIDPRGRPIAGASVSLHPMLPRDELMKAIRERPWPQRWGEPLPAFFRGATDARGELPVPEVPGRRMHQRITAEGCVPFTGYLDARDRRCRIVLSPATELAGTVRLLGGTPVPGVVVSSGPDRPISEATTDAQGEYRLAGVPVGAATLRAEVPWGLTVVSPVIDTRSVRRYDFVLDLRAAVRGHVVDRRTGRGIGGARVVVYVGGPGGSSGACAWTTTAADGGYALDRLPRGLLSGLLVSKEGYVRHSFSGHPFYTPLRPGRPLIRNVRLERGAIVRGEVRFMTGEPVPFATVHLRVPDWDDDRKVATDGRGRFLFPAVKPGVGKFHVSGPGFYFPEGLRGWRIAMAPDSLRVVIPESGEVRKILHVSRGAVVEGVVRAADGSPKPGATVISHPRGGVPATADVDGRFRLAGVPPGETVRVRVFGDVGYAGESAPFRVRDDEVVAGVVVVTRDPAATGISGRVYVARAALPDGVRLAITSGQSYGWEEHAHKVPVSPNGSFRIEGLRAGDHSLLAVADGCGDAVVLVEDLATDEFRDNVAVRLFPAESISGRVVLPDGEFTAGAPIHVVPWARKSPRPHEGALGPVRTLTGDSGRFTVDGLAPGRYRVSVGRPGWIDTAKLAAAGDDDVLLEPRRGRVIAGMFLDADTGKPAAGVSICAIPTSGRGGRPFDGTWLTRSGPDGRFVLDGLFDGIHELWIADPRHFRSGDPEYVRQERSVRAGAQNLKIYVVPGAVIEGRVLGGDRQPLGHVRVASRRVDHTTWTNHDGTFRLSRLQPGKHDLHIYDQDDRGLVAIRKRGVPAGARDLIFVMESGPCITGRVLDPDGKAPAGERGSVGFSVSGANRFRSCRLEKDGTFRSPPLKEGTIYDLRARGFDDTIGVVVRRVMAGESRVRLYLRRGGTISGRVVDENGDPAPGGIYVSAYGREARGIDLPQGDRPRTWTNEDGTFVLRGVGDFTFGVYAAVSGSRGYLGVRTEASKRVRPGTKDLVLPVVRGVPFTGRLVDGQGRPVSCELQRWQHNGSGNIGNVSRSSEEGRFRWPSVRPGPLRLVAVIGGRKVELGTFTAPAEDVVITVP